MDTGELESALKGTLGKYVNYAGVFSSDGVGKIRLQLQRDKALVFIANTLESSSDVSNIGHWVCFYIAKSPENNIIFFDSYGIPSEVYSNHFRTFFIRNERFKVFDFKKQIQPDLSYKCGLYVLYFIHNISHYGLKQTLIRMKSTFSEINLYQNDRIVVRYYFTYLKRRRCSEWKIGEKRAITYKECIKANTTYL